MSHVFTGRQLWYLDIAGDRDQAWTNAFGLGREAMGKQGLRCLACGRKLWSADGTRRIYCDDTCHNRHRRRVQRYKTMLRESGQPCPYCRCRP